MGVRSNQASRLLGTLFDRGSAAGMSDEQLLARFVSPRGAASESAFTALVERHGPMVLGVCRTSLGNSHDAEDAFQATFLVLARRASSLRDPARLAPWLHGVARRSAQKARSRRTREARIEQRAAAARGPAALSGDARGLERREEAEALHAEIGRLPERYQTPVLLCDLQGLTHEEAARRLGWPPGTVGVRLMRARARLRSGLARRGLAPGVLVAPALPRFGPLEAELSARTVRTSLGFASRATTSSLTSPTQVAAIAAGVLNTMTIKTLTLMAAWALAGGLAAAGTVAWALQSPQERPAQAPVRGDEPAAAKTATERGASILTNGGFEKGNPGTASPAGWASGAAVKGVSYHWDRTVAHGGAASLHLRKTEPSYFPIAQWTQRVARSGTAARLKVGGFIKAEGVTKAILDVQFLDKDGKWSHAWAVYVGAKQSGDPPVTHDWTWREGVVAIPEGTKNLVVAAQIYGPGDVWFDDLKAEYTDAAATNPTGE